MTRTRARGRPRGPAAAGPAGLRGPGQPGLRLRTLADVFAYAQACGVELRIDATETQVRRPQAHRAGRRAFVSGKPKQNTIKLTTCSDAAGRTLWTGAAQPGRMHDQTAVNTEGVGDLLAQYPHRQGPRRRGLPRAGHGVSRSALCPAPPRKPTKDAPAEQLVRYEQARKRQSSRRICAEHALAEHKQWRSLQRWIGPGEHYSEAYLAVAGLVSDRAARR